MVNSSMLAGNQNRHMVLHMMSMCMGQRIQNKRTANQLNMLMVLNMSAVLYIKLLV